MRRYVVVRVKQPRKHGGFCLEDLVRNKAEKCVDTHLFCDADDPLLQLLEVWSKFLYRAVHYYTSRVFL